MDEHLRAIGRARVSLEGLSVGDAFGERFFVSMAVLPTLFEQRWVPDAPWGWTDDTAMALSVVDVLERARGIDEDLLAAAFAARYAAEPARGYGAGAHDILSSIARGEPWRVVSSSAFEGRGSYGNGAAMRAAPIGAYFSGRPELAAEHARRSALPTHAHPEGIAGAVAVAVAASLIPALQGEALLSALLQFVSDGATRDGIRDALALATTATPEHAAAMLGNGAQVSSADTVPFSLYCAAHHGADFEEGLRFTVAGLGDRDTTCAIVGGIIAGRSTIPASFIAAREPLPH